MLIQFVVTKLSLNFRFGSWTLKSKVLILKPSFNIDFSPWTLKLIVLIRELSVNFDFCPWNFSYLILVLSLTFQVFFKSLGKKLQFTESLRIITINLKVKNQNQNWSKVRVQKPPILKFRNQNQNWIKIYKLKIVLTIKQFMYYFFN